MTAAVVTSHRLDMARDRAAKRDLESLEALPLGVIDHVTLKLSQVYETLTFIGIVIGDDLVSAGNKGGSEPSNTMLGEKVISCLALAQDELEDLANYVFHREEHPNAPMSYSWEGEIYRAQALLWLVINHGSLEGALGESFRVGSDHISTVLTVISGRLKALRDLVATKPILAD